MPCTLSQAHDQILALLHAASLGIVIQYPDMPSPPARPAQASWAQVLVEDSDDAGSNTLVGSDGSRRYETHGIITVAIYAMSGDGRREAQRLAELVLRAYRGRKTTGGVWFRRERVRDVGPDGTWYHVNAIIEYQYDTIEAGPFDPRSIGSLVAWWSGNIATPSSSTNRAYSTVGPMAQAVAADRPLVMVLPNGVRALRFDGATDDLNTTDVPALRFLGAKAEWMFHVRQNNADVPSGGTSGTLFAQWGAAERVALDYLGGGTQQFRPKIAIDASTFANNNYNVPLATLQAGAWLRFRFNGTEPTAADRLRMFVDELEISRAAAGSFPATLQAGDAAQAWLGSLNGASNWGIDIAHAYVFSDNLSPALIAALRAHEAPQWA